MCLWTVPEEGVPEQVDVTGATADFEGHLYGVRALEFHPTAPILASTASTELKLWDLEAQENCLSMALESDDAIANMCFNATGSLLATSLKDRTIRVVDPRTAEVAMQSTAEVGQRSQRVTWCTNFGTADVLMTVGRGDGAKGRQLCLWDARSLGQPAVTKHLDHATGQLVSPVPPAQQLVSLTSCLLLVVSSLRRGHGCGATYGTWGHYDPHL